MSNWKHTLDISDIWFNDDYEVDDLGEEISKRLSRIFAHLLDEETGDVDNELWDIVDAFSCIIGFDDVSPHEEFDEIMERLYNWADQEVEPFGRWPRNKMCWIKTSF